jgi:hypothetical protein
MSDIEVKLSKSGIDTPLFHDYQYYYPARNRGGNGDELTFGIENVSGNLLSVSILDKTGVCIADYEQDVDTVVIKIHGAIEHSDFFSMLKLIKEAHEVNSALGGKHGS